MKKVLTLLLMLGLTLVANAQMVDPVKFTSKLEMLKGDEAQIVFSGKIDRNAKRLEAFLLPTDNVTAYLLQHIKIKDTNHSVPFIDRDKFSR